MKAFHVHVHAWPAAPLARHTMLVDGVELQTLAVSPAMQATPMQVTFEAAAESLAALPRMFLEPDGSFVWAAGRDRQPAWQIDGNLYDAGGRLVRVELLGSCPATELDQLFAALRLESAPLLVQLAQQAVFVDDSEFRRWLYG